MLKIDKERTKIDIYYIGYVSVKKIGNCNTVNRVNPLYLMIDKMMKKEKSGYKYFLLDDVNENKKSQKDMRKLAMELEKRTKQLMIVKKLNMAKIFKKLVLSPVINSHWIKL